MQQTVESKEVELRGISLSGGLSVGVAHRVTGIDLDALVSFRHETGDDKNEIKRFENALRESRNQIERLRRPETPKANEIFTAQLAMLEDKDVTEGIFSRITQTGLNAECLIAERLVEIRNAFESMENDLLRARALDIQDVYHRILANLLGIDHVRSNRLRETPHGTVLVSQRLLPSDLVHLDTSDIAGIITETGSAVSHAAILARSLRIPCVSGVRGATTVVRNGDKVLVDGTRGVVVRHPGEGTIEHHRQLHARPKGHDLQHRQDTSIDGTPIQLLANASSPEDIEEALVLGANGIGLFRTEFYYLRNATQPSQEQETGYYRRLFDLCNRTRLCLRLLDFGGDKTPVFAMPGSISRGPFGNRGIRYLLNNRNLFLRQLSCIAGARGDASFDLLVPFVTVEPELADAVNQIETAMASHGINRHQYRIGMMLEVPSAFLALDRLLPLVDFVSVGTNDLIQYCFACDREDEYTSALMEEATAAMIHLIGQAVHKVNASEKELRVCGELATDANAIPLLVHAGVRSFSVSTISLERVRERIAGVELHRETHSC